jgi:hypothetical protein
MSEILLKDLSRYENFIQCTEHKKCSCIGRSSQCHRSVSLDAVKTETATALRHRMIQHVNSLTRSRNNKKHNLRRA